MSLSDELIILNAQQQKPHIYCINTRTWIVGGGSAAGFAIVAPAAVPSLLLCILLKYVSRPKRKKKSSFLSSILQFNVRIVWILLPSNVCIASCSPYFYHLYNRAGITTVVDIKLLSAHVYTFFLFSTIVVLYSCWLTKITKLYLFIEKTFTRESVSKYV